MRISWREWKGLPGPARILPMIAAALLVFAGCGEDDSPTGNEEPDDGIFDIGDTTRWAIDLPAGGVFQPQGDSLAVLFPEPAHGHLTYGAILAGPATGHAGGRGLYVRYEGDGEARLRVPYTEEETACLLTYGEPAGSWHSHVRNMWYALPVADTIRSTAGDSLVFLLGLPQEREAGECEAGFAHWLITIPAASEEGLALRASIALARQFLAAWLDSLDEPLRTQAETRMRDELPPHFYPDGNYYAGFARLCPSGRIVSQARIGIAPQATSSRIAHQIGHYAMHILAGDEAYRELESHRLPDKGIGAFQFDRLGLIEDYAHWHEYLLAGSVEGAGDPNDPSGFFPSPVDPARLDAPSLEGYGVLLFEALTRNDSTIVTLGGDETTVPALGLDYGDLAPILRLAKPDMNRLWNALDPLLESEGCGGCLPLLAAATGWNYSGHGVLVGPGSVLIQGARLSDRVMVNGREYVSPRTAVTASDGSFRITNIFPGPSRIVVEAPADTFELATAYAFEQKTDRARDFDRLSAWASLDGLEKVSLDVDLSFAAQLEDSVAVVRCTLSSGTMLKTQGFLFEPSRVRLEAPLTLPCSTPGDPGRCWVIDSLRLAYSLETGKVSEISAEAHTRADPPARLTLRAKGEPQASMHGCNTVYFLNLANVPEGSLADAVAIDYRTSSGERFSEGDLRGAQDAVVRVWRG